MGVLTRDEQRSMIPEMRLGICGAEVAGGGIRVEEVDSRQLKVEREEKAGAGYIVLRGIDRREIHRAKDARWRRVPLFASRRKGVGSLRLE